MVSTDCRPDEACSNRKCIKPCQGACGINAKCQVINHNPICSCPTSYTGDPFIRCIHQEILPDKIDACIPSPCGPNSICRESSGTPTCSCKVGYFGAPPYCKPECIINSECSTQKACINEKCVNPCENACGANAECHVISHSPSCFCLEDYTGNPFIECHRIERVQEILSPCQPSPCGANAICKEFKGAGACTCLPDFIGNPYEGCRPECLINSDCPANKACIVNKCKDPCPGACAPNAVCQVVSHAPSCSCNPGLTGDPFQYCVQQRKQFYFYSFLIHVHWRINIKKLLLFLSEPLNDVINVCQPSPCGPNSRCQEVNKQAVCLCMPDYSGSPPGCHPECVISTECPTDKACLNQKCSNPCVDVCGINTECRVINHSPVCSCKALYTGDPFTRCNPLPRKYSLNYLIRLPIHVYCYCHNIFNF